MATFVLVHGFFVGPASWDATAERLRAAGHDVVTPQLPGTASIADDRASVTLRHYVDTVVAAVDDAAAGGGPVVLVGSSFAGRLVQIAVDLRADTVARAVYVDSSPLAVPEHASDDPAGADVSFSWDLFSADELRDLGPLREQIEREAVPFPAAVVRDGWPLADERRHGVPTLVIASGFDETQLDQWRHELPEVTAELDRHRDLTIAWLPTSHWPHLTRTDDVVALLLD